MDKHLKANRGVRLSDDVYLKLKLIASKEKRSFNNYLEIICENAISDYEAQNGTISVDVDKLYE